MIPAYVFVLILTCVLVANASTCINVSTSGTQIDRICPEGSFSSCYNIFVMKMKYDPNLWLIARYSKHDDRPDVVAESLVSVRHPKGEKVRPHVNECIDFQGWTIDHKFFIAEYVAAMVAAPFLMSSLSLDSDDRGKQVLEIGLGGGTFDMGLHEYKPYVNITALDIDKLAVKVARKWFGVVDSEYHHSVVEDGVKFVKSAVAAGRKFDVVVVDACDLVSRTYSRCPAKPFLMTENLRRIKEVMSDKGTLLVNIITRGITNSEWNEVLQSYTSIFPTCLEMETYTYNIVLVCVPYKISGSDESIEQLNERLNKVVSALKLDYALRNAYIAVPEMQ